MLKDQIVEPEFGNTTSHTRLNPRQYVYIRSLVDSSTLCDEFTGN